MKSITSKKIKKFAWLPLICNGYKIIWLVPYFELYYLISDKYKFMGRYKN